MNTTRQKKRSLHYHTVLDGSYEVYVLGPRHSSQVNSIVRYYFLPLLAVDYRDEKNCEVIFSSPLCLDVNVSSSTAFHIFMSVYFAILTYIPDYAQKNSITPYNFVYCT